MFLQLYPRESGTVFCLTEESVGFLGKPAQWGSHLVTGTVQCKATAVSVARVLSPASVCSGVADS